MEQCRLDVDVNVQVEVEAFVCVASAFGWVTAVQRSKGRKRRVESSRVAERPKGGLGLEENEYDHDDEDDQIVFLSFFLRCPLVAFEQVATEWINAVCAGEAVGSVDWYDRMGWAGWVGILELDSGSSGLWMAGRMVEGYLARQ